MLQVLSADSAVLSSDNEVEAFLTAHLQKLRDIRQLVGGVLINVFIQKFTNLFPPLTNDRFSNIASDLALRKR